MDPKQPFELEDLPPELDLKAPVFHEALMGARVALAELKGYTRLLPNPDLLTAPALLQESLASSEIENIHTTLPQLLEAQLFPGREQSGVDKEVLHYREAMQWGHDGLKLGPLNHKVVLGLHQRLLPGEGGSLRTGQNIIAQTDSRTVVYTPPAPEKLEGLMTNWLWYINEATGGLDHLMRALVGHYQFEAMHPFDDGNGRTGRILLVLGLVQDELLHAPVLYLSGYIQRRKRSYYQFLRGVSEEGDWEPYLLFMLEGVRRQALASRDLLLELVDLLEKTTRNIQDRLPKIYTRELVEALFSHPVVSPVRLGELLDVHYTTASRYLKQLTEKGLLEATVRGKYRFYINRPLMELLGV